MPATPELGSDALEAIHSSASGMFRTGTIDAATISHFDRMCRSGTTAKEGAGPPTGSGQRVRR